MEARNGARILVLDEEDTVARLLARVGYTIDLVRGLADALDRVRAQVPDLFLASLRTAGDGSLDSVEALREAAPDAPVIVMPASGETDRAVEAIQRGAYCYLAKPFHPAEVLAFVERALAHRRLLSTNAALSREIEQRTGGGTSIIGRSAAICALRKLVASVAPSASPVLITGESGTGKELVARALHRGSGRKERPFVSVACVPTAERRLEADLFGGAGGASGAPARPWGLLAEAWGGTLFLENVCEMPRPVQAKVLAALRAGEVRRPGVDAARRVDVRVIASSTRDPEACVAGGKLDPDLLSWLGAVRVAVPPLRDRREDIPDLVDWFVARARRQNPKSRRVAPDLQRLAGHAWPGNVRELENLIEYLVIVAAGGDPGTSKLARASRTSASPTLSPIAQEPLPTVRELKDAYIACVLARCGGDEARARDILGVEVSERS